MSETFGQFGKTFQETVMTALLQDSRWAEQVCEVVDTAYFDLEYLRFLADRYFDYARKYKAYPSLQILLTIIRDDLKSKSGVDDALCAQIIDYLKRSQTAPPGDLPFVKDKSLEWCRKQALRLALEKAAQQLVTGKYELIAEDIKKATMVGTTPSIGTDFMQDFEARYTAITRNALATGLAELDKKDILNGGLGAGELGCVVANTGVGKSHFLVLLGANAMRDQKNVLHYTMELSEATVGLRYDSNLCDINSTYVIDHKEDVKAKYAEMKLGKLIIKNYPTGTPTIYTIRSHLERLRTNGFIPDLIIIDSADNMRSTRQYESPRFEIKLVYEEVRALAEELRIPVWTVSQSNKEGASSDIVDITNMGEAYAKGQICDIVLTISRKSHEKALGIGRLFVAKNRAGKDGILYPVFMDTSKSIIQINGGELLPDQARVDDDEAMKQSLRSKWREVKDKTSDVKSAEASTDVV